MRQPKDTDYIIPLPDVGDFRFGRQTFADRAKIRADYISITKANTDPDLSAFALILAKHANLCVDAPGEWQDFSNMEVTQWKESKLFELYALLAEQESSFRFGAAQGGQAAGQGGSPNVPTVVQEEV